MSTPTTYDASSVDVLEGLDPVRVRPGMYIGDTGKDGFHHLLWEIVDNSVDEAMGGFASHIEITLNEDGSASVSDNGRGIPVDVHPKTGKPTVETVLTVLHAGGKFGGSAYGFSGGLHGVGSSVVNALSTWMRADIRRGGTTHTIEFAYDVETGRAGAVTTPLYTHGKIAARTTGTTITFLPDPLIFGGLKWDADLIRSRIEMASYLNPKITFVFSSRTEQGAVREEFYSEHGLLDYANKVALSRLQNKFPDDDEEHIEDRLGELLAPIRLNGASDKESGEWDIVLRWFPDRSYVVTSFANGIVTKNGGSHVKAFESVLTSTVNKYATQSHVGIFPDDEKIEAVDIRTGLGAIVSAKVANPEFVGQTKSELSNRETGAMIRRGFSSALSSWLEEHPVEARLIATRAYENMRARKKAEDAAAKAFAEVERKGVAPRSLPLPAKLSDCSTKDRMTAELFIVEGDSAAGPAIRGRDSRYQAVLPIRGKGLNIERVLENPESIESNAEVQGIIATLGAGSRDNFDSDKLRYGKIIILTDADADGRHIELLLVTMFFRLMTPLVTHGHLYAAKPPLFSTVIKGEKRYFKSGAEKDRFLEAHPKHSEKVLRFKGLGEMNDSQLRETAIDPTSRQVVKISCEDPATASATIANIMGKNSSYRWQYLRDINVNEI